MTYELNAVEDSEYKLVAQSSSRIAILYAQGAQILPKRTKKIPKKKSETEIDVKVRTLFEYEKHVESDQNISTIKRERLRRQIAEEELDLMRQSLPVYDLQQIRKFKLPLHESYITNLEESGFTESAKFVAELIDFQDYLRTSSTSQSINLTLPQLKLAKEELRQLCTQLQEAETYFQKNMFEKQCETLIYLGLHFAFGHPDFWWLGEQILIRSISISTRHSEHIGQKLEALGRYTYAKYLLDQEKKYEQATEQFKYVRIISINQPWTSKGLFADAKETLFMQANVGLFKCIIKKARSFMETDVEEALILVEEARKRAAEACYRRGEVEALVLRGLCEMIKNKAKPAISSFFRALYIQQHYGTIEGICKIRVHLAKAYLMDNCANSSLKTLMELKTDAENNGLLFYVAEAYKSLGEYYLTTGEPDKSLTLLCRAVKIFEDYHINTPETRKVGMLQAISTGLQYFPHYCKLLLRAADEGEVGKSSLSKIINWKNDRSPFVQLACDLFSGFSCDEIIEDSCLRVAKSRPDVLNEKLQNVSSLYFSRKEKEIAELGAKD